MEIQLQAYNNTLMAELGAWNRQESTFRELFGHESINDREFLKMKLDTYERLSSRYGARAVSTDDRSMLAMLHFQRKKLERAVYPGLIRRLLHKAFVFLQPPINGKREMAMASQAGLQTYTHLQLPVKEAEDISLQRKPDMGQSTRSQQHREQGQRSDHPQWKKKHRGHSL